MPSQSRTEHVALSPRFALLAGEPGLVGLEWVAWAPRTELTGRESSRPELLAVSDSVQRGESEQVGVSVLRRHPPLEREAARAGHGQSIAVPRGLRRVARHPAVRAVVVDESLKVAQQGHRRLTVTRSWAALTAASH